MKSGLWVGFYRYEWGLNALVWALTSWRLRHPFDLHLEVEGAKLQGFVRDAPARTGISLGDARVIGSLEEGGRLSFAKSYGPDRPTVLYQGRFTERTMQGSWQLEAGGRTCRGTWEATRVS